eukprot:7891180-Alexandrium_andersonii.AAC.1
MVSPVVVVVKLSIVASAFLFLIYPLAMQLVMMVGSCLHVLLMLGSPRSHYAVLRVACAMSAI